MGYISNQFQNFYSQNEHCSTANATYKPEFGFTQSRLYQISHGSWRYVRCGRPCVCSSSAVQDQIIEIFRVQMNHNHISTPPIGLPVFSFWNAAATGAVNTLYQLPCVLSTPHCFCETARTPARCTTQCTSSYKSMIFIIWCNNNKNNATVTGCIATPFTAAQLSKGMALPTLFPPVLLLAGRCHALSSSASTIQIGEHAVGSVSPNSCGVYRH